MNRKLKQATRMETFLVTVDLVGFSSRTFLDTWGMPLRTLRQLTRAVRSDSIKGVISVGGSISSEDDNAPGDNKVYLAVNVLVEAETERQAESKALSQDLVDAILELLPARGGFCIDGSADCIDSRPADEGDLEELDCVVRLRAAPRQVIGDHGVAA